MITAFGEDSRNNVIASEEVFKSMVNILFQLPNGRGMYLDDIHFEVKHGRVWARGWATPSMDLGPQNSLGANLLGMAWTDFSMADRLSFVGLFQWSLVGNYVANKLQHITLVAPIETPEQWSAVFWGIVGLREIR